MFHQLEESLDLVKIQFKYALCDAFIQPCKLESYKSVSNMLLLVEKGEFRVQSKSGDEITIKEGEICFLPKAFSTLVSCNTCWEKSFVNIHERFLSSKKERYKKEIYHTREGNQGVLCTCVSFDAKIFGAMDIFDLLNIAPFQVDNTAVFLRIFASLFDELQDNKLGSEKGVALCIKMLVIQLLRNCIDKKFYKPSHSLKLKKILNPRLSQLMQYIGDNLGGDLTNIALGSFLSFSKGYIGQFFKSMMKMSLQDYIKVLRLQKAAEEFIMNGNRVSVQEVSRSVGYSNFSYFCRNFKDYWGITAREMYKAFKPGATRKGFFL